MQQNLYEGLRDGKHLQDKTGSFSRATICDFRSFEKEIKDDMFVFKCFCTIRSEMMMKMMKNRSIT